MCITSAGARAVASNRLANLAELCWHHHWLVHEGGWGLVAEADGELTAIQPNGETLTLRSVSIDPGDGGIETRNTDHGITIAAGYLHPPLVRRRPQPRPHHHQPHAAMGLGTPRTRTRTRCMTSAA